MTHNIHKLLLLKVFGLICGMFGIIFVSYLTGEVDSNTTVGQDQKNALMIAFVFMILNLVAVGIFLSVFINTVYSHMTNEDAKYEINQRAEELNKLNEGTRNYKKNKGFDIDKELKEDVDQAIHNKTIALILVFFGMIFVIWMGIYIAVIIGQKQQFTSGQALIGWISMAGLIAGTAVCFNQLGSRIMQVINIVVNMTVSCFRACFTHCFKNTENDNNTN